MYSKVMTIKLSSPTVISHAWNVQETNGWLIMKKSKNRVFKKNGYNKDIPASAAGDVDIYFSLTLTKILKLDEKSEELTLALRLAVLYPDKRLIFPHYQVSF